MFPISFCLVPVSWDPNAPWKRQRLSCGAGSLAPTIGSGGHGLSRRPDFPEAGTPPRSGPVSSAHITGVHRPDHSSAFAPSATPVPMAVCRGRARSHAACGSRCAGNPLGRIVRRRTGSPEPYGQWHPGAVPLRPSVGTGRRTREYAPCRAAPIPGHDSPGAAAWDQGGRSRSSCGRTVLVTGDGPRCRPAIVGWMGQERLSRRVLVSGHREGSTQPLR